MDVNREIELFQSLARIEAQLNNCVDALVVHTDLDATNFLKLETQLNDVRDRQIREVEAKIEAINLVAAKKAGEDEALASLASARGAKVGGAVATVISTLIAGVSAYFSR